MAQTHSINAVMPDDGIDLAGETLRHTRHPEA